MLKPLGFTMGLDKNKHSRRVFVLEILEQGKWL